MTAKKDWQEQKRRYKASSKHSQSTERSSTTSNSTPNPTESEAQPDPESETYEEDMDTMRCILYAHGGVCDFVRLCWAHWQPANVRTGFAGGYYFGSTDQERLVEPARSLDFMWN